MLSISNVRRPDWLSDGAIFTTETYIVLLIVMIGTVLRVAQLGSESFWIDEVFSVRVASEYSYSVILFELPLTDPHPPLYYALMRAWVSVAGTSEVAARAPSVVFGILTIPAMYKLGDRLFNRKTALLAASLVAISPIHIWYSQETRMYALLVLFTIVSFLLFISLIDRVSLPVGVSYVLVSGVLIYTHVYGLFILFVHVVYVLYRLQSRRLGGGWKPWVPIYGSIGLLALPWIGIVLQRAFLPHLFPEEPIEWLETPSFYHLVEGMWLFSFGATRHTWPYELLSPPPSIFIFVIGLAAAFLVGYYRLYASPTERDHIDLVALWFVLPIMVPFILSFLITPMFEIRYMIVSFPAFLLLISFGIQSVQLEHLRVMLILLVVVGMLVPLPGYYTEDHKDQWESAADIVAQEATPSDAVFVVPGWTWYDMNAGFEYYFDREDVAVHPVNSSISSAWYQSVLDRDGDIYIVISYVEDEEATIQDISETIGQSPSERIELRSITIVRFSSSD